ncbi:hypothetical protein FRC03_008428 [Tulasnella sp. 419]|nr:hypothetical protein FRC03_008428 [Tulasnella sp. 419]
MVISLPPELYIQIIQEAASPICPSAYRNHCIPLLLNLSLVNHAFYEWSSPFLYSRVSVTFTHVRRFCRTVIENSHIGFEEIPSERRVASRLGNKVRSISLSRGDSLFVPLDEILAILHALSDTLERLIINPAQLMDVRATSEGWERDWGGSRIRTAIQGLTKLEEFCNFENHDIYSVHQLPIGSYSSLKRLVLFNCVCPDGIPTAVSSFKNLEKFALVSPYMEVMIPGSDSAGNILEIAEEAGDQLKEIILFAREVIHLSYRGLLPASAFELTEEELCCKYQNVLDRVKWAQVPQQQFLGLRRTMLDWMIDSLMEGELWSLGGCRLAELKGFQL